MNIITNPPWWYWILAMLFTAWHVFRGWWYYGIRGKYDELFKEWTKKETKWVLCFHYSLLCLITTPAGFFAFWSAYCLWVSRPAPITAPFAGLVGFLFLFGLVGITGELPPLIQRGQFPAKT